MKKSLLLISLVIILSPLNLKAQQWLEIGNTVPPGSVLGTLNDFPLPIITNNVQRMHINAISGPFTGFVGIGDFTTPLQRLHVLGDINLQTDIFSRTAFNDGYRINDSTVLQVKNNGNLFVGWGAGASWINLGVAQNCFIGNGSGLNNTVGFRCTFTGFQSGKDNTFPRFLAMIG